MTRVYCCVAMTGRDAKDVLADQRRAAVALRARGLIPLDPTAEEGVKPEDGVLRAEEDVLLRHWRRDKELIRRAHVLLDLSGPFKSEGVAHEVGYARYHLWKPTVRVWPGLGASVAHFEGDVVVQDVQEAAWMIKALWGTPWKRLKWRIRLYLRCRIKALINEIKEWHNVTH